MANEKRPTYLKPVPGDARPSRRPRRPARRPRRASSPEAESTILGLTPPLRRGHSGMFITDVIGELGYAARSALTR